MGADIDVGITRNKAINMIMKNLNNLDNEALCKVLKVVNDEFPCNLGLGRDLTYFYISSYCPEDDDEDDCDSCDDCDDDPFDDPDNGDYGHDRDYSYESGE